MANSWRRLRRLWELWSDIDTAAGLLGWFAWAKSLGYKLFATLVAGTAFGGWTARMTHWPLPIVVLMGIVAAAMSLFLWNQITWRRDQKLRMKHSTVAEQTTNAQVVARPLDHAATYFSQKRVRLVDVIGESQVVRSRTFEDCEILGPAVLIGAALGFGVLTDISWFAPRKDMSTVFVELPDGQPFPVGAILLDSCVFRRCRFHGISVVGAKAQIAEFRRSMINV